MFKLMELPYAQNGLEPVIDANTMSFHYGKHHQTYVDNLNKQVELNPNLEGKDLREVIENISKYSVATRNNAGGVYNHDFFWNILAPIGKGGEISGDLSKAINQSFGSFEKFKEEFEAAGAGRFGSGWAWLIVANKELKIVSTPNQDNTLMDSYEVKGEPILVVDVWEHAYYLQYQNRRAAFLKDFWQIVNWNRVNELYSNAIK
ncbi:MAG: superoxide dismutase [Campylobacteraceae bacterium]|nr:superoxide dismutase [Campylobacteraceae bacterium]